jgi:starch phosphorylase
LFRPIVDSLLDRDDYLVLADYSSYIESQLAVSITFRDQKRWTEMSILNSARVGKFSSDRSIREYCERIWSIGAASAAETERIQHRPGAQVGVSPEAGLR